MHQDRNVHTHTQLQKWKSFRVFRHLDEAEFAVVRVFLRKLKMGMSRSWRSRQAANPSILLKPRLDPIVLLPPMIARRILERIAVL